MLRCQNHEAMSHNTDISAGKVANVNSTMILILSVQSMTNCLDANNLDVLNYSDHPVTLPLDPQT